MTPQEWDRRMNDITERQEVTAEQLAATDRHLAALAARHAIHDERIDDRDERIARFERSNTAIAGLLQKHDTQIEALTEGLNNLVTTVNRYITARGSNGAGGDGGKT